jgi:pimeloyl-ACP methyl ester carboxylesterase
MPGFGKSDEPRQAWGSDDYKDTVARFLDSLAIENPILIGHSYGGKVSIRLAAERSVNKLVLIDSAGIRPTRTMGYYLRVYSYKAAKAVLELPVVSSLFAGTVERFKSRMGSEDYRNASGVMRQTLVRSVNEDVRELLPRIKAPTLLVWGENDTATPVSDGRLMEKLIPDAGLVVFKNAGHFSYLDKLNDFLIVISEFLKKDMEAPRE